MQGQVKTNQKRTGLSRPGALQMLASAALMIVAAIGPILVASSRPTNEWLIVLTGFPALGMSVAGIGVLLLYFIGFLRYCASKGYSKWLGFWLFIGNIPGFVVLLLLPDLSSRITERAKSQVRSLEASTSGGNE